MVYKATYNWGAPSCTVYISHLNSHPIVPRSLLAPKHPKVLCTTVLGQEGPEAKNFHMDSWAHRPSPTGSSFHSNLSREHAKAVRFQLFWRREKKKESDKSKVEATHGNINFYIPDWNIMQWFCEPGDGMWRFQNRQGKLPLSHAWQLRVHWSNGGLACEECSVTQAGQTQFSHNVTLFCSHVGAASENTVLTPIYIPSGKLT